MSLEAFIWVSNLPLDVVGGTPYRVLVKLANHAHSDGRNAWRDNGTLADDLHTSKRTIERAIKDLRHAGLIKPGDQRLVEHLRADRRPTVYDLNLTYGKAYDETLVVLDGATPVVGPHGPTNLSRADRSGRYGPTTVVAQGTVIEPVGVNSSEGDHRASDGPQHRCPVRSAGHRWRSDGRCGECWMTVEQLVDYWASVSA